MGCEVVSIVVEHVVLLKQNNALVEHHLSTSKELAHYFVSGLFEEILHELRYAHIEMSISYKTNQVDNIVIDFSPFQAQRLNIILCCF